MMRYKVIATDKASSQKTRAEYLFQEYCLKETMTPKDFIHKVKTAYYKYNAEVYNPGYAVTLVPAFKKVLSDLPVEIDQVIVDIGAGSGQVYDLVTAEKFKFTKYYFIEPFQSMIDQFDHKDDGKVFVICDYFESPYCTKLLNDEKGSKLFIMCAALRTLDNINEFADSLKSNMKPGDKLFLPLEPNNDYFGSYYKALMPFVFGVRVLNKIRAVLSKNLYPPVETNDKHPLVKSLEYLKKTGVVNAEFNSSLLYAIVYYNNYHAWLAIDIPEDYNDGFFTIAQLAKRLGGEVTEFKTNTYLYGFSFGVARIDGFIEKMLGKFFPSLGASLTAVITKK